MLFGAKSRTINQILLYRSFEQPEEIAYRFLFAEGADVQRLVVAITMKARVASEPRSMTT